MDDLQTFATKIDYPYFVGGPKVYTTKQVRFTPFLRPKLPYYMTGGSIMNSKKGVLTQATGLLSSQRATKVGFTHAFSELVQIIHHSKVEELFLRNSVNSYGKKNAMPT